MWPLVVATSSRYDIVYDMTYPYYVVCEVALNNKIDSQNIGKQNKVNKCMCMLTKGQTLVVNTQT